MSEKILIIEDDARLAQLIQNYLQRHDYEIYSHDRGDSAEAKIEALQPDLIILDVMLPGKSGFDICRSIHSWYTGLILLMTASEDSIDEIIGLELGADDYLAKPVEPRLLLARVRALLRRKSHEPVSQISTNTVNDNQMTLNPSLVFGSLCINPYDRSVHLDGHVVELTTAEFDLLWLFAQHAGTVLSRDDIYNQVRGIDFDGLDRSIDARVSRLRKKLQDNPDNPLMIKTVRGKGYLFLLEGSSNEKKSDN